MGIITCIKERKVCIKHLSSQLKAIQKLQLPMTPTGCRRFVEMVNFPSIFCPELQKLLKPIYNLMRKGQQFIWGNREQDAFKVIKHRLFKAHVLQMPNCEGRFHLYSDIMSYK